MTSNSKLCYSLDSYQILVFLPTNSSEEPALVYDSLHEIGRSEFYRHVQSHLVFLRYTAIATASFLTGFAVEAGGVRTPIALTMIGYVIALMLSFLLVEPSQMTKRTDRHYLRHMMESAQYVWRERDILYAIMFGGLFWACSLASHSLQQAYFLDIGVPVKNIGL